MNFTQKIFLVDDDLEDREIFIGALRHIDNSIQCRWAPNGEEAINILMSDLPLKPNLIFLDVNMPRLTGQQVLTKIKNTKELKDIKVIMYSTFFSENDVQKMKNSGASGFLSKPTQFTKLVEALTFILEQP
jgi:CheY-like chemotaxis protein